MINLKGKYFLLAKRVATGGHLFHALYFFVFLSFIRDIVTYWAMQLDMAFSEPKYLQFHCLYQSMSFVSRASSFHITIPADRTEISTT